MLQTELGNLLRGRADEGNAGGLGGCRKARVFTEKSVAWVHGLRPALASGFEHGFGVQVALLGRRWTDAERLVGVEHVLRMAVGLGVNRDRANTQALESTD